MSSMLRQSITFAILVGLLLTAVESTGVGNSGDTARVNVIATGLDAPWALAFGGPGDLFVTERPGRIRLIRGGRLIPQPVATLPVAASGEAGLLGLATSPSFAADGSLYACYTLGKSGKLVNRVARLTVQDGRAGAEHPIIDDIPGAEERDGCRVKFGPDGMLYVSTGDAGVPEAAQRLDSLAGKILRLRADGSIPSDNPFSGSPIYALGFRNPQGLAWYRNGRMFAADFGVGLHDEINEVATGGNYGWPAVSGLARDPRYRDPIFESAGEVWKPSGIAVRGDSLYVAALLGRRLVQISLRPTGGAAVTNLLLNAWGRIRDVVVGPDNALYVATSNRDGRGAPHPDDDRILRVLPTDDTAAGATGAGR